MKVNLFASSSKSLFVNLGHKVGRSVLLADRPPLRAEFTINLSRVRDQIGDLLVDFWSINLFFFSLCSSRFKDQTGNFGDETKLTSKTASPVKKSKTPSSKMNTMHFQIKKLQGLLFQEQGKNSDLFLTLQTGCLNRG